MAHWVSKLKRVLFSAKCGLGLHQIGLYHVIFQFVVPISVPVPLVVDRGEDQHVEDEQRAADGDGDAQGGGVVGKAVAGVLNGGEAVVLSALRVYARPDGRVEVVVAVVMSLQRPVWPPLNDLDGNDGGKFLYELNIHSNCTVQFMLSVLEWS